MLGWKRLAVIIGLYVGLFAVAGWFHYKIVYKRQELLANKRHVTVAELEQVGDVEEELPYETLLELSDAQPLGEACLLSADHKRVEEYQLVSPTELEADSRAVIIYDRRKSSETSLRNVMEQQEALLGRAFAYSEEGAERLEVLKTHFPDVDLEEAIYVSRYTPSSGLMDHAVSVFLVLSLVYSSFTVFALERKRCVEDAELRSKLDQNRTEQYAAHPAAMRLLDQQRLGESSLQVRRVDLNFDVPSQPPIKQPRFKGWVFKIVIIVFFAFLGAGLHYYIKRCDFYNDLADWATLGIAMLSTVVQSLGTLIALVGVKRVVGRQEEKLPASKTKYRETGFHQYHSAVLAELGFTEVGDYQLVGASSPLSRTIFLSRQRNLLVELGIQTGAPFFTLESLLNDGRFLETHSMLGKSSETASPLAKFIRRSAAHGDLLLALEEHDQLVGEFTAGGGVREAEFTPERFPRFLAWATSNEVLTPNRTTA